MTTHLGRMFRRVGYFALKVVVGPVRHKMSRVNLLGHIVHADIVFSGTTTGRGVKAVRLDMSIAIRNKSSIRHSCLIPSLLLLLLYLLWLLLLILLLLL